MFWETYSECREDFIQKAEAAHLRCIRFRIPAEESNELFQDFAFLKKEESDTLLVHFSGVHGIEAYIGSAIQRNILQKQAEALLKSNCSVLFVHAVNPYGMAFYRRGNQENVDLNRNFVRNHTIDLNQDYRYFSRFLRPHSTFSHYASLLPAYYHYLRLGKRRAVQAMASGQIQDPQGPFFMGTKIQFELHKLAEFFHGHFPKVKKAYFLDVHSGLGKKNQELLFIDAEEKDFMENFVEKTFSRKADIPAQESDTYNNQGKFSDLFRYLYPEANIHYLMQEFATYGGFHVLNCLRAEARLWTQRNQRPLAYEKSRTDLLECFFPKDNHWREQSMELGSLRYSQLLSSLQ